MDAEEQEFSDQNEGIAKNAPSTSSENKCLWDKCNRIFSKLNSLANHVNNEHIKNEKEGDFCCRWEGCSRKGRSFNARYKMLIHVRTHTNEKPHICKLCGKSFSRLENLKIHHRSHTGEKPYTCPVEGCDKAYSNSSDRFKHTRTHFVDKPYFCKKDGCNKRYTDPSSLRKHMKTYGHYRDGRTCILKSKIDSKQCTLTCNQNGNSEKNVSSLGKHSRSSGNKICSSVLSVSPVLTVNVPSLISNPVFMNDSLKPPVVKFKNYYLGKSTGENPTLHSPKNDINRNDTCPLDLTVNHQDCSIDSIDLCSENVFATKSYISCE